jgi:hypothetical protein
MKAHLIHKSVAYSYIAPAHFGVCLSKVQKAVNQNLKCTTIFFFLVIVMCVPSSVLCVLFVCKYILLPPGVNPIAVKKIIITH